jgi:HSP20 family protein
MGIIDKVTSLLPWHGERQAEEPHPAMSERSEPDGRPEARWFPSTDVRESDDEVTVTIEVPGLEPADLDLMLTPVGLIIRGEKREVQCAPRPDVKVTPDGVIVRGQGRPVHGRDYYVAECHYGSFVRTVPLPPGLDLDQAEARAGNGVLTVRFPKAVSRPGARRIPVQRSTPWPR